MANNTEKTPRATKKDLFDKLLTIEAVKNDEALKAFIEHEIELLKKKNAPDKKKTPHQEANEALGNKIIETMADGEKYLISQIIHTLIGDATLTSQRVGPIMTNLKEAGLVAEYREKGRVYYSKIVAVE